MAKPKILFVDDEPRVLRSYQRQLEDQFDIDLASSGAAGLERIQTFQCYAVVVADMKMPGMNGIEFLQRVETASPSIVRLMLTGNIDQNTAVRAVNEGNIFRFLNKPCSTEEIAKALHDAYTQHQLLTAEKELLEETLCGSVKLLTDVLSILDENSFREAVGHRELIRPLARALGNENSWDIELAAMLHNIGRITLPPQIAAKLTEQEDLTAVEKDLFEELPKISAELLANIPRLKRASQIVLFSKKNFDGSGYPQDAEGGDKIPLGARILRAALDADDLLRSGIPLEQLFNKLSRNEGRYDPQVLEALREHYIGEAQGSEQTEESSLEESTPIYEVQVEEVFAGQKLLADVLAQNGILLLRSGHILTGLTIAKLQNYARTVGVKEPLKVNLSAPPAENKPQRNRGI